MIPLELRVRRAIAVHKMTNPQLARRLRVPVDSVRRVTRQLVIAKRLRIHRYKKPYLYGLPRG